MGDRIGTHSPNCWAFSHLHYDCAVRHIAELEAKLATAVGALEPFAAVADEYDDREDDSFEVWQDAGPVRSIRATFKLRMYRIARQALASIQERT